MVFGHNLQHMAPFGVSTTGFCMVFRHATLVCSTPGAIFGTPDPNFGPRLGQGPFLTKNGAWKKMVLWKKWSRMGLHGILQEGNGLYGNYPGGLWARPFPPKPSQKIISSTFPDFGTGSGAALGLHGGSLLSLLWANMPIGPVWGQRWSHLRFEGLTDPSAWVGLAWHSLALA